MISDIFVGLRDTIAKGRGAPAVAAKVHQLTMQTPQALHVTPVHIAGAAAAVHSDVWPR